MSYLDASMRVFLDVQVKRMLDKGYAKPSLTFVLHSQEVPVTFTGYHAKLGKNGEWIEHDYTYFSASEPTLENAMAAIEKLIDELTPIDELRRQTFINDLAKIAEAGKKLNVDIQPILDMLKASTENLLVAPKPDAGPDDDIPF